MKENPVVIISNKELLKKFDLKGNWKLVDVDEYYGKDVYGEPRFWGKWEFTFTSGKNIRKIDIDVEDFIEILPNKYTQKRKTKHLFGLITLEDSEYSYGKMEVKNNKLYVYLNNNF